MELAAQTMGAYSPTPATTRWAAAGLRTDPRRAISELSHAGITLIYLQEGRMDLDETEPSVEIFREWPAERPQPDR